MKNSLPIFILLALGFAGCETNAAKTPQILVELQDATSAQCPSGGTVIVTGTDKNSSGTLDEDEITGTRVVCNGVDSRTLVRVLEESPGVNCTEGGQRIETGADDDADGVLDDGEVDEVSYVCNGATGQSSLIRSDAEPAGEHCGEGGTAISSGLDDNGNGVLDDDEIDQTEYVCNGLPGSGMNSLVSVLEESAGANCPSGGYGIRSGLDTNGDFLLQPGEVQNTVYVCDGSDGATSLIRREDEPAGGNCPFGGQVVLTGLDADGNGYLDDMEAQNTSYVCHGADGADGIDGLNNLFETAPEPAGATCAAGGLWILSGPDSDGDGVLDSGEIQVQEVVCNGLDGTDGINGYTSLVLVTAEPVGANCATGGQKVQAGLDLDRDGVLDSGEVTQTQYVCQGADGSDGLQSLVTVTVEPAGVHCAGGGILVQGGLDADADGILDAGEVTQTQYVCDGADGLDGLDGTDGLQSLVRQTVESAGANCAAGGTRIQSGLDLNSSGMLDAGEVLQTQYVCNGADGSDGSNGLTALVRQTAEPAGANCATGGTRLDSGLDANVNGTLDSAEVAQTRYICNGIHGADGSDGSDGLTGLVRQTAEPVGANCATGGTKVQSGLDLNGSGVLDLGEVTATQYVCNGAAGADGSDGTDGLTSLVRVTLEAAGANCADGGLKLESGLDANGSGVLDPGEITQTQYVCHGVDGLDGVDGSDGLAGFNSLVALTLELAGANCAAGGTKVQSGLDTDADSTLDAGEVTSTRYVCNGIAGSDGADGVTSLVATSIEPAGANCAAGGTKVQSGPDTDGDNTLDAGEVTSTQYVCHGEDGSDLLLRASNAAWGGVCTFGGVKLETGVDLNANGTLDDPEVTRTQYVCNQYNRFVAISAGQYHTCALKADGSAWCWGSNTYSQLGDGTNVWRNVPVPVSGLSSGTALISAGGYHSCAIKTDGTSWCWGLNNYGQIGDGSVLTRSVPAAVADLASQASGISCGSLHSCAVLANGSVWCWGSNSYGQLGDGSTTDRKLPVEITGITAAAQVSCGERHTCAVKQDGSAWCWGNNLVGQLGDGTNVDKLVPTAVSGASGDVAVISAGMLHSCLVRESDLAAYCWGNNGAGQLGDGTNVSKNVPTLVPSASGTTISAGRDHSCSVRYSGSVKCWGFNSNGQLGDGTTTSSNLSVAVSNLFSGASVSAGGYHTCVVKTDGTAWCWGQNTYGQLGFGSSLSSYVPAEVFGLDIAP